MIGKLYKVAYIDKLVTKQIEHRKKQVERAKKRIERAKEQVERAKKESNSQQLEHVRKQLEDARETDRGCKETHQAFTRGVRTHQKTNIATSGTKPEHEEEVSLSTTVGER